MQRQLQKKHTDKNDHEADMQVLWKHPSPKTMPDMWDDVHRMQENWSLQNGVQKQED